MDGEVEVWRGRLFGLKDYLGFLRSMSSGMGCLARKARASSALLRTQGSLLRSGKLGLTVMPGRCFLFFEVVLISMNKFRKLFSLSQEFFIVSSLHKGLPFLQTKPSDVEIFIDF